MLKAIGKFVFIVWATLWVWLDELGKKLAEMSAKEFLKLTGKTFLYGLSVIGWIVIIYSMYLVGWVIS